MMINSKKIFGMLFVGLAMMIANPNLGWAAEEKNSQSQDDFLKTHGGAQYVGDGIVCGQSVCTSGQKCLKITSFGSDLYYGLNVIMSGTFTSEVIQHKCIDASAKVPEDYFSWGELRKYEYSLETDGASDSKTWNTIGGLKDETWSSTQFADSKGKLYSFNMKDGKIGNVIYQSGVFVGCEAIPVKLYKQRKCFFCPLFAVIYNAADTMAVTSFNALAAAFATIIALGLGIYIAFQTLTHVSSLTKQDAPKFLGTLMRQIFKFLIAFFLLMYSTQIYHRIVNPILEGGLAFGQVALTQASTCDGGEVVSTKLYEPELYSKLECFITNVQKEIAFMQSIGTSLMCVGGNAMMFRGGDVDFGDGFWMALQGAVIGCFGFLLSLAFAFYLIDAVVQLGIVGALMPFLIASWPFKMTSKYTSTGFNMILNSFFVFVFIGLVVSVNFALIDAAMISGVQDTVTKNTASTDATGTNTPTGKDEDVKLGGLQGLYDAINTQDETKIKELTDISGMGFIILLICCIFGFKFCGQASSLAEKMAGGGLKGIGSSIGTMAASAAVSGAKKVTKPIRKAVSDRADSAIKAAPGAILGAPAALFKKMRGKKSGGKTPPKAEALPEPSTPTPSNVGTPQPEGGGTPVAANKQTGGDATSIDSSKPMSKAELNNEFAQTNLSKDNDDKIAQSKQKETQARKNQADKTQSATAKKAQLAAMSDQNSPEAKALAKDIRSDEKEAKNSGKEANKEMRSSKKLQKQNNVMEKAYGKARKDGCTVEKAREIAIEAANSLNKKDVNKKQRYDK